MYEGLVGKWRVKVKVIQVLFGLVMVVVILVCCLLLVLLVAMMLNLMYLELLKASWC